MVSIIHMHLKQEYFNDKRRLPVTEKKRELTKEEKKIKKVTYFGIGTGIFLAILMLLVAYYIFFISYSKDSASNFLGCFLVIIVIIFTTLIAALSSSKKSLKMIFLLFFSLSFLGTFVATFFIFFVGCWGLIIGSSWGIL